MVYLILLLYITRTATADLLNTATYGDSILKYYSGNGDYVIQQVAIARCAGKGGELVMPKESKLNQAVASVSNGYPVWIGGGDFCTENDFIWSDGSDMEWTCWDNGEPNNAGPGGEDCIVESWSTSGMWNDMTCCYTVGYVCQMPSSGVTNEDNEFTLFENDAALTYSQAQKFCRERRSRLAKVTSDDHKRNLFAKLNDANDMEFWVSEDENEDNAFCKAIRMKTFVTSDCNQRLPFICEQAPPNDVKVSDETPVVVETSSLTIGCSASGVPLPSVAWYRNDKLVENQSFQEARSTLILNDITSEEADMYVCRAENEIKGKIRVMEGYSFVEVEPLH